MINLNISKFTKSCCLMLIIMSVVVGIISSCNKKSKVESNQNTDITNPIYLTLKVTKTGTGSVSVSWYSSMSYGQVADATTSIQIPQGAKVSLTATPSSDNGYILWNNTTKSKTYEFTMDADKSVDVNIVSQYMLTVSKTGKGSVSASWTSGSATDAQLSAGVLVDENTAITLTATPDASMPNVVWNGNITGNTLPLTITANQQVSVAFSATPPTLYALNITQPLITDGTITAYSDANRTMPITDLTKILKDAKVYIKVVPATGKLVKTLTGIDAGSANSDNTQATVTMTMPKQISASFETITYSLTLNAGTNGTIQAFIDNAYTIPVADLTKIAYNTKVYLKITPNTDYRVSSLSGTGIDIDDAGSANSDNRTATITMTANKTIFASFSYNFYKLTITPATNGTIQAYTDNTLTTLVADISKIPINSKVYLKITPNTGYIVSALSGIDAGSATNNNTQAVVTMSANKTISATIIYNFEFTETATTATLTNYLGTSPTVIIPSTYNGKPVTAIDGAFSNRTGLTSITIPNSVTAIGRSAFSGCTGLTSITIPNNVTAIGRSAFSGCTGLTSITIPNSVTAIGQDAFYNCTGLTSITIPNSVTAIGQGAFENCTGLTSITIPNSVTAIGLGAFYKCTGLTSITIPNSVTTIECSTFAYCTKLTSIAIGSGVTSIISQAFNGCSSLTDINVDGLNANYSSMNGVLFNKAQTNLIRYPEGKVGSYTIPNNVLVINGKNSNLVCDNVAAFSGCKNLTSVIIPNTITTIENYAFENCSSLTSVIIGNGVTSIGFYPFNGCSNLTSLTVQATSPPILGSIALPIIASLKIYVPSGSANIYRQRHPWNDYYYQIYGY